MFFFFFFFFFNFDARTHVIDYFFIRPKFVVYFDNVHFNNVMSRKIFIEITFGDMAT